MWQSGFNWEDMFVMVVNYHLMLLKIGARCTSDAHRYKEDGLK